MSLKSFHVFFIAISTLTLGGFGVWCIMQPNATAGHLALGVFSFALVGALLFYGKWFLGKIKDLPNGA